MDNRRKQAACALMTALTVLVTAAFAPAEQRKAACKKVEDVWNS